MPVKTQHWKNEVRDALNREDWALHGPKRPVKVVALDKMLNPPLLRGYFTVAKFLLGRTPQELEARLGLKADTLRSGAFVYDFSRLPQVSEFEDDLTAKYPGGLAFSPWNSDFPEGSDKVFQWRLRQGVSIPASRVVRVKPGQKFPYVG